MALEQSQLEQLARMGAAARLIEIDRERTALLQAFPDLGAAKAHTSSLVVRRRVGSSADTSHQGGRRRRRMNAAQRRAVSERMRKYWAERRRTAKGKS